MPKEIVLTQGYVAIVDDSDYDWLSQYQWHVHIKSRTGFYALTYLEDGRHESMHRLIMGLPIDWEVDHKDNDGLNNQRGNLRLATRAQQSQNKPKSRIKLTIATSQYKGVSRNSNRWRAYIRIAGKHCHLGYFDTEQEAALAYDEAARKEFGEYAKTNF